MMGARETAYSMGMITLVTTYNMINRLRRNWFGSPGALVKTGATAGAAVAVADVVVRGSLKASWGIGMLSGAANVAKAVYTGAQTVSSGFGTLLKATETIGKIVGTLNTISLLASIGLPIVAVAGKAAHYSIESVRDWMHREPETQTAESPEVAETQAKETHLPATLSEDTLAELVNKGIQLLEHADASTLSEPEQQKAVLLLALLALSLLQAQTLANNNASLPAATALARQGLFKPADAPATDVITQDNTVRCVA